MSSPPMVSGNFTLTRRVAHFFRSCASALKLLLPRRMLWTSFTVICDTAPRWKLSSKVFVMWWRARTPLGYHARFVADGTRQLKTESKRVPLCGQERSDDITIIGIYIKDAEPGTRSPGTVAPLPSCAATQPASVTATRQHQLPDAEAAPLEPQSRRGSKKSTDQLDLRACDPVRCVRFCLSQTLTPLSRIFTGI